MMTNKSLIILAASAAILCTGLTGCATSVSGSTSGSIADGGPAAASAARPGNAANHAAAAEKALARRDFVKAVRHGEEAVAFDPANPAYRTLLGRAYLADGRFASAERSFLDVIELGAPDARSVIGLALARTALNKPDLALASLDAHSAILPAGDYGLALALAGDSRRAIAVLSDAIRVSDSSAQVRQNLAMAYALEGRWRDAQLAAARDASPEQVMASLSEWARIARPGAYPERVASLLKVTPNDSDPGQPSRLALREADNMDALAAAAAEPVPNMTAAPTDALAPIGPAVAAADGAPLSAPFNRAAESNASIMPIALPAATTAPVVPRQPIIERPVRTASAAAMAKPGMAKPPVPGLARPAKASGPPTSAVQLGAFESDGVAKASWQKLRSRFGQLAGHTPTTTRAVVNGKTFYRLTANGLTAAEAKSLCATLRRGGRDCFVRANGGPTQMAAAAVKRSTRVAAR